MVEKNYTEFQSCIGEHFTPAPVYLIFGEEYLCKSVYNHLVNAIIPEDRRKFGLEELDGNDDNAYEAIERLNTFSLDSGTRVIGFIDSNIFYSKEDTARLVERIKTSVAEDALAKGSDLFLKLLSLLDIPFETLTADDRRRILQAGADAPDADPSWLEAIINYCKDHNVRAATATDAVSALAAAIEKGFAPGSHFIITAENVDKRRKLYKTIKDHGVIIDCSVPARDTRANKARQEEALWETARAVLGARGKTMPPDAFAALRELTGFDLRTFHNSLEKLAAFTGERTAITAGDVKALLKRTKKDPVYELTGAIFDKNIPQALFLLESLLAGVEPMYPLQIIAAIVNQTRKLLIIRDFMDNDKNKTWRSGLPFDGFKRRTLPAIEKYDDRIKEEINRQEAMLSGDDSDRKSGRKKQTSSDLMIAPNPANLFPTYQNFKKAGNFSTRELLAALTALAETDRQLKSSGLEARLLLENLIIRIIRSDPREKK